MGVEVRNTNYYFSGDQIESPVVIATEKSQCNIKAFISHLVSKGGKEITCEDVSNDKFHMVKGKHRDTDMGTILKISKY